MAFIHSGSMGAPCAVDGSNPAIIEVAIHFTSPVSIFITRCSILRLLLDIEDMEVRTAICSFIYPGE